MRILGIDPGVRGGLALVEILDDGSLHLLDAIDVPVAGAGAKERVDPVAISEWMVGRRPQHALIERAQAMPKQGASSGFKYGRAVGALEAVIACCGVPITVVEPSMWKRAVGLRGSEKEQSRLRALQLFPHSSSLFARKKDHGRAEAALIAAAWRIISPH